MLKEIRHRFRVIGAFVPTARDPDRRQAAMVRLAWHAGKEGSSRPEFVNRIDAVVTYEPLTPQAALTQILDQQIAELQESHRPALSALPASAWTYRLVRASF